MTAIAPTRPDPVTAVTLQALRRRLELVDRRGDTDAHALLLTGLRVAGLHRVADVLTPPDAQEQPVEPDTGAPEFGAVAAPGQVWHLRDGFVATSDFTPARIRVVTVCRPTGGRSAWFDFADLDRHPWRPVGSLDLADLEICYTLASWPSHLDLTTTGNTDPARPEDM